jgi:hypothetical protein
MTPKSTTRTDKKVPNGRDLGREAPNQDRFAEDILGRDSEGKWHVRVNGGYEYLPDDVADDRVVVLDETGIEHVQDLEGYTTAEWVEWIDERRGWEECYFVGGLAQATNAVNVGEEVRDR